MESKRIQDYQRNAAFTAFMLVVTFAAFVYLTSTLSYVVVPLVWSAFFAVPLTGLISNINNAIVMLTGKIAWYLHGDITRVGTGEVDFIVSPRHENRIIIKRNAAVDAMLDQLENPCLVICDKKQGCCGRRRFGSQCCEMAVRITSLSNNHGPKVNRLVVNWAYYVVVRQKDINEVVLELFLDQAQEYPATWENVQTADDISGTLRLDRSSTFSYLFAVILALLIMIAGVSVFGSSIAIGARALKDNTKAYKTGFSDFLVNAMAALEHFIPEDQLDTLKKTAASSFTDMLTTVASDLAVVFQFLGVEALLFFLYVCFWIFEPLPFNSSVAQVFRNYLLLKTLVCLLFASLMALLLRWLACPLWSLFFPLSFILNYIPEFGFMVVYALSIPAVLFNGNLPIQERQLNTVWVIMAGMLIKIVTANCLEVQMYATMGGAHMRMHPVVMMGLMMLCETLLGVSGMFLAIPIMAAVKYYLVSTDIPQEFLNPLLVLMEGDEAGPHKIYVDKQRENSYGSADP